MILSIEGRITSSTERPLWWRHLILWWRFRRQWGPARQVITGIDLTSIKLSPWSN